MQATRIGVIHHEQLPVEEGLPAAKSFCLTNSAEFRHGSKIGLRNARTIQENTTVKHPWECVFLSQAILAKKNVEPRISFEHHPLCGGPKARENHARINWVKTWYPARTEKKNGQIRASKYPFLLSPNSSTRL